MIRKLLQSLAFTFTKAFPSSSISSPKQTLQQLAEKWPIPLSPSPIITQKSSPRLKRQHKEQMGLFIPKSPFNTRLTKFHQNQYLDTLTKQLYNGQAADISPFVRILQNNYDGLSKGTTLSKYINLIYKDIYGRFLVAKGLGVQWQGKFSNLGIMNKCSQTQYIQQQQSKAAIASLLNLISCSKGAIQRGKSMGLYSYAQRHFVDGQLVGVKTSKKMGYYVKMPLSHYGKYSQELNILQQKGAFMSLLVVVQDLAKLINPNALCIQKQSYFIVLKKYDPIAQTTEYLIVSNDLYLHKQKQYFKQQGYEKHQTLMGKYLLELSCKGLPVIAQIQGYQRSLNCYLVNSQIDLADYQRAKHYQLEHGQPFINESGQIICEGINTRLVIGNSKIEGELLRILSASHSFVDIYQVVDQEVYFQESSKEVLYFRLSDKFYIDITQEDQSVIEGALRSSNAMVVESKVQIPRTLKAKLPRQRRRLQKQRKQLLKQMTDHPSLEQSLRAITNIPISSLTPTPIRIPLLLKDSTVVPYEAVLTQQNLQDLINGKLNEAQFLKGSDYDLVWVFVSESLMRSLVFLSKGRGDVNIHNVIIEPQSQTQELIPLSIHLNYMLQKAQKLPGRRTHKNVAFQNNFSLIKLHPTLTELQGSGIVNQLLAGAAKSNNVEQYGLGLQALRLWTARRDNYLGDRRISDLEINSELRHSTSIRKVFWDCISMLPPVAVAGRNEVTPLLYINRFMLDMIDCYINNMQEYYKHLQIHQAYVLTIDFFQNIVEQIYVQAIKKRVIAYPNNAQNQEHFYVLSQIIGLVALISPLMPFSAFHISKHSTCKWPTVSNPKFYESIPRHNSMIKLRVDLQNKMKLNRLRHFIGYLPSLKPQFSERDLQLFLDLDKATTKLPQDQERVSSFVLNRNNHVSSQQRMVLFKSEQHCIRCDPKSQNTSHLCTNCVAYLQEQVNEPFKYWPQTPQHENKQQPKAQSTKAKSSD